MLATAAALGFLAVLRPHPAILALTLVAPVVRALQVAQSRDVELLAAVTVAGALIAAARPRLTPLGAGRPHVIVPALLLAVAMTRIAGVSSAVPLMVGMAAAYVASRHARDGVARPIHLIRAAAVGGIISVAFNPEAAESGVSTVAVSFSLVAAVLALGSTLWMLAAFLIRVVRGFKAYPADRVLMGGLAAIGGFVALLVRDATFRPELMIPFWILAGAALARADGDAFNA